MQPSEIHLKKELADAKEVAKTGTGPEKEAAKQRVLEIENALKITHIKEKASIATDEQV